MSLRGRAWKRRAAALLLQLAVVVGAVAVAEAYVPPAKRVSMATTKLNRAAKRNQTLRAEVVLLSTESLASTGVAGPQTEVSGAPTEPELLAEGTLVTSPDGRSRLELQGANGVERHLRSGMRVDATRDGRAIPSGPLRLPPLHLLQAASSGDLANALANLGTSAGAIKLGHDGATDAYVIGGRGGSALWVDMDSLGAARIDLPGGSIVRLGPTKNFGGIQWPAWLSIEKENEPGFRLEFREVKATKTDAATFAREWLVR